jgi:hypothetical protein
MSKWISVKEKLPSINEISDKNKVAVLVWDATAKEYCIATLYKDEDGDEWWADPYSGQMYYPSNEIKAYITHWMPLPKQPKKHRIRDEGNDISKR